MTSAPASFAPHDVAWLDAAEAALDLPDDPTQEPLSVSRDAVTRMNQIEARLAARTLARIRRIDDAELAKQSGSTSTRRRVRGRYAPHRT